MSLSHNSPITVVTEYFTALAEGRVSDALNHLDAHVRWHQPGRNQFSTTHTGPTAVADLIGKMMTISNGTFSIAPTGPFMSNGDLVAVPVKFSGTRDGLILDQTGMDLLTVRNGKISEVHLFSSDGTAEDEFWGSHV